MCLARRARTAASTGTNSNSGGGRGAREIRRGTLPGVHICREARDDHLAYYIALSTASPPSRRVLPCHLLNFAGGGHTAQNLDCRCPSKGVADLSECPVFVMDEADKLLSPVMEQSLSFLPDDRQVMLFSATFPMIVKDFKVREISL